MFKLICTLVIFIPFSLFAQTQVKQNKPKLVVGIVIDQMRYDYLTKFNANFSEGGFKRLLNLGFNFNNAHYNYFPTQTGPGHASIYTGTTPSNHGIVANDWYDLNLGAPLNCVEVHGYKTLGNGEKKSISPQNLKSIGLSDVIKNAYGRKSKIVSLSIKDRGAVLPGGFSANLVLWLDRKSGEFISSSYYGESLKEWVNTFNKSAKKEEFIKSNWELLLPLKNYVNTFDPDNNAWEAPYEGQTETAFPHPWSEIFKAEGFEVIAGSPFGNTILTDLAIDAIKNENLGNSGQTDFINISYSSPDLIGHQFGPHSLEIEDTYYRLDRDLERLFKLLDEQLGSGNYLLFLSSDHAVAEMPQWRKTHGLPGGVFDKNFIYKDLKTEFFAQFGDSNIILNWRNQQIYFNQASLDKLKEEGKWDLEWVKRVLKTHPAIKSVWTAEDLLEGESDAEFREEFLRGYYEGRSGDLFINFHPGWIQGSNKGTTHTSVYSYDTHIPILFYGWGIKPGFSDVKINPQDIVPTICTLLNINMPDACTGTSRLYLMR